MVAEGVETETEHKHLVDLEVAYGQGYLYRKTKALMWAVSALST